MTIGGVAVSRAFSVPMRADDDDLVSATIVGRAQVDFPNGGRADGLLVRVDGGALFAVVWERTTRRFVRVPLTE